VAIRKKRLVLIVLVLALLLSGCSMEVLEELLNSYYSTPTVHFRDMEYTHPDMMELEKTLSKSCETLASTRDIDAAMEAVYAFYDVYDRFYTNYNLADLNYSRDLTDLGWEEEYYYCAENAASVDAGLEELYYTIADAPLRKQLEEDFFGEGYFESYEGESIWDDTFLALMEQEAQLQSEYYALSDEALEYEYYSEEYFAESGTKMAELFVKLIALRQQIAEYAGYESYPQFAYDFYYYRDYTPEQAESYLKQIGQRFYDLYVRLELPEVWEAMGRYCAEADTFGYVKNAASAMGGTPAKAFALLEEAGLYDIAYGENKYNSSFELYLWSYYEPFIFMNPYLDQTDKLTFAHEFGHFCNDYVCSGSYAGTDIAEVHSQAFEYLSLCYGQDTELLTKYKLADSLSVYMEQAAYALFEQQVYGLKGEALTVENVAALYEKIGTDFGFDSWDWDSRDFVTVTHYYTNPMYIVSYVVSNDLALQIYQLELQEQGKGLALYEECLNSQDSYIIEFANTYGLESPFTLKRLEKLEALFTGHIE